MDCDESNDDLFQWIDCNIYGLNDSEEKEQLISLISGVLERIPSEDREIIMYKRGVRFVAPLFNCTAQQMYIDPLSVRDEKTTLCQCSKCNDLHLASKNERYGKMIGIWLVCLSSDILKRTKDETLYTIAHELAHVYLEHGKWASELDDFSKRELEADKQVIAWGFESELRQSPFNYIYGEGEI